MTNGTCVWVVGERACFPWTERGLSLFFRFSFLATSSAPVLFTYSSPQHSHNSHTHSHTHTDSHHPPLSHENTFNLTSCLDLSACPPLNLHPTYRYYPSRQSVGSVLFVSICSNHTSHSPFIAVLLLWTVSASSYSLS